MFLPLFVLLFSFVIFAFSKSLFNRWLTNFPHLEKKDCQAGTESEAGLTNEQSRAQRSDSSASEYEEIIEIIEEEVTDSSDCDETEAKTSLIKETIQESDAPPNTKVANESKNTTSADLSAETDNSAESNIETDKTAPDASSATADSHTNPNPNDITDSSEKGESPKPALQGSMHQQKMLQNTQSNFHKVGVSSTYSKTPGGNTPKNFSSDRSMHAPNNTSSSSAQYSSQTPIVTVTAGRADNTSGGRDLSSSSTNNSSGVVGSSGRQVDRLGVPQKEDSGTESGEDLRLIAAGLRDQLQMKSDSNIIDDVTCALSRLESSLKEGKDISVDTEKRKALLALVARLQDGLTSPEKLAEIAAAMSELDGNDVVYGETSSPEADAHRSGKQRFAKRRSRVNRHTVGVSREELADARRYMEDMLMMENISHSTTPDASTNSPPQWFPLEKNASSGAILIQQPARQNYFLAEENVHSTVKSKLSPTNGNKRRPVSGDFSVSFEPMPNEMKANPTPSIHTEPVSQSTNQRVSPDNNCKNPRFSNKKLLMKRANTIDLSKAKRFGSDFDTDSDAEDKSQLIGLKRAVHPSVRKRVENVVPPFEPKTENDRKFLAFINKQSDKPGLGWTSSRSVANWSNKFGNLKNSFEVGATTAVTAAKPPQVPGHQLKLNQTNKQQLPQRDVYSHATTNQQIAQRLHQEAERQAAERRRKLEYEALQQRDANLYAISSQQMTQRLQQEAERQAEEHKRKLQFERLKYERRESEKIERQRQLQQQQQERLQKERLEREYYERHIRDHDIRTQHAQHNAANAPQTMPINEFKHAPQSVFRPIDSGDMTPKTIYKPIAQLPTASNTWQLPSPNNNPFAKADNSFITSPPPSSKSPIGLPWAAKPAVDASSFKNKANRFEERSRYDNYSNVPMLQRHNSLRMPNAISGQNDDFKKRPSLPNTTDPYGVHQLTQQSALPYLPPPTNVSFIYDNRPSKPTYLSYPCLPTAVAESNNYRSREDSLTNPQAMPLVLTSANPSYCPAQKSANQEFLPRDAVSHFDITSPADSTLTSPSATAALQNDFTDDDIESDSLLEYRAVSKVMGKPQSQTAITVGRRTGHVSDDEVYGKNSKAAKNLLSTMKSIGGNGGSDGKRQTRTAKRAEVPTSPKIPLTPDGRSYQAPIVEPLFPDVTRYEANRQPLYDGKINNQPTPTSYTQSTNYGQPLRTQPSLYKSMENVSMRTPTTKPSNAYVLQEPSQQQPLKPYVSETQTSYVVTYPTEDTTDDEEVYRHSRQVVPDSLPLRRSRNISETSTVSSSTASLTYANNLPSPNTSWTSNPIIASDTVGQSYYNYNSNDNQHQHFAAQPMRGEEPAVGTSMSPQYQHNQSTAEVKYTGITATNYQQTLSEPPKPFSKNFSTDPSQYTKSPQMKLPAANYDGIKVPEPAKPSVANLKGSNQHNQTPLTKNYSVPEQQMKHPTTNFEGMSQKPTAPSKGHQQNQATAPQKITPKAQVPKEVKPQQTQVQKSVSGKPKQSPLSPKNQEKSTNKKPLANMKKSVSEDYKDIKPVSTVREQTTSVKVTQKAVATKANQHHSESVLTDTRRQSLGNALNGQHREQIRTTVSESHQSQQVVYKSSAPADTPDIVKSSLPKDENQPILKKFGPPQRHHYMPNSYKSPSASTGNPAATTASTTVHTKSVEVATNKSILKTSQQTVTSAKPVIIENPATPQPDDDYIPRNIVFNNVHAFTSMSRRQDDDRCQHIDQPVRTNKLCKSESWKQIINLQNQNVPQPVPRLPQPPVNELRRTKSGHSLAVPKMYEAAIDKTEISEKQNIMAAYFAANKSPTQQEQIIVEQSRRSAINRTKTSEKISASRKSMGSHAAPSQGGLTRSATMPHIASLNLLDESNVEDAFEQLMMGS